MELNNLKIVKVLKNVVEIADRDGEVKRYYKVQRRPYKVKEKEYFGYFVSGLVRDDETICSLSQVDRDAYVKLEGFFKDGVEVFLGIENSRMSDMVTKDIRNVMNVYACRIDEDIVDCFPLKFKNNTDKASLEMLLKRIDRQE